ncbi:MAG: aminopeptidase P family protein [Pseudomonadota bacterium]
MFQTYEPRTDRSFASKHAPLLRAELKRRELDGFIVPQTDEYQNEYTPASAERLAWVSGFTGSAGAAIVMQDKAVIFVDGRYTLQVRDQVDDALFAYEDLVETPPAKWIETQGAKGAKIGYDPMLHSLGGLEALEKAAAKSGVVLVPQRDNPVDAAWADRPAPPSAEITPHDLAYAGESAADKQAQIAETLKRQGADAVVLTSPASLAWLFNIRGGDVAHTPLPLGRAILSVNGTAELFIAPEKVTNSLAAHLGDSVCVRSEAEVADALRTLGTQKRRVSLDPALAPAWFFKELESAGATVMKQDDPCALPRALKNTAELDGARTAHIRDGVAVTRFLHWLSETAPGGGVDEISAAEKLEHFRADGGDLKDVSFESISGAGPNGAVIHYRVTTETNRKLEQGALYLIDSGAQYVDGTTDITRTIAVGDPTAEMRDRFTRVLKGHIAIATARFPKGTSGAQIDAFARLPLWEAGLDYDHGTGHGVGSYLGVHEGPQRIAKAPHAQALLPGMILSNEPGYYKTGEYGIRIENLVIVTPLAPVPGGEREMMEFETITLAPFDRSLIDPALLSAEELAWVNAYHVRVRETLAPRLPEAVSDWLHQATEEI